MGAEDTYDEYVTAWTGSDHYKTGGVEPFDLYCAMDVFQDWAIVEICQHALRNRSALNTVGNARFEEDMKKIIHYAQTLIDRCYRGGTKGGE